jgi:hypothetical protein
MNAGQGGGEVHLASSFPLSVAASRGMWRLTAGGRRREEMSAAAAVVEVAMWQ